MLFACHRDLVYFHLALLSCCYVSLQNAASFHLWAPKRGDKETHVIKSYPISLAFYITHPSRLPLAPLLCALFLACVRAGSTCTTASSTTAVAVALVLVLILILVVVQYLNHDYAGADRGGLARFIAPQHKRRNPNTAEETTSSLPVSDGPQTLRRESNLQHEMTT